jgi:hypothetical protein
MMFLNLNCMSLIVFITGEHSLAMVAIFLFGGNSLAKLVKKQTVGSVPRIQFHILISTWKLSIRMTERFNLIRLQISNCEFPFHMQQLPSSRSYRIYICIAFHIFGEL